MERFGPAARAWFRGAFSAPTPVQERGWERIAAGDHALLIAPTGSGKTLAAFLWSIDRLLAGRRGEGLAGDREGTPGTRVVYVSPLKALVYDIERNLRAPLEGIAREAARLGLDARVPGVDVRTGDTSASERRRQLRRPGEILCTTPESLYLLLGSQAREGLRGVHTVIVDEVHALAPDKRGAHLALSLERLAALAERDPQRIGLSATARPAAEVARFLGGDREVTVIDASVPPAVDLEVVVPVADMNRPEEAGADEPGLWPAIHPRLLELVRAHRTTILFVNSRGLAERLTRRLNELAGEELARAHHGSLAHEERRRIEAQLGAGELRAIVATSSLELGIDMGAVELVILVESPGSVARGLQRVGRAGHQVGEVSRGRLFPKHRGDLLEAAVVAERMTAGAIESLSVPRNPLDVLAQQVVAAVAVEPWDAGSFYRLVRRAASFAELPRSAWVAVLDMLSGRYPSPIFADLRPRLVWDRDRDQLTARRGAGMIAILGGGTIPDRGTYGVYHAGDGGRVGELDEEMVNETIPGQVITLGASSWRVERITRDQVLVSPAPGEIGKLPFWRGEGPGRPIELGRALGAFLREVGAGTREQARARLESGCRLDPLAAQNLLAYLDEQRDASGELPTDRTVLIERFRDELGDWRLCILTPFGARVHAPWALALDARIAALTGVEARALWSDDGIMFRFGDSDAAGARVPGAESLVPDPEELEELLWNQLGGSALFAGQFRENAARSLLMPRRRPGQRTPLWVQRLKSQELLAAARRFPDFPVIVETYRSCLEDVFDVPALEEVLRGIRAREIRVHEVETRGASPFARSLAISYAGAYLYEGDAPLAERRVQALALDRRLLRELLGREQLGELLDPEVVREVEDELQGRAAGRRARDAGELHDLLRRAGDLRPDEIAERAVADAGELLAELLCARRAVPVRIGGEERVIAVEDAALYRDALGIAPPDEVPAALLEASPDAAIEELVLRFARVRGPLSVVELGARLGVPPAAIEPVLVALAREGALVEDVFGEGEGARLFCHPESLRRIKRRALARLRDEVSPVDAGVLARFLPAWHGVGAGAEGMVALREAVARLEGLPLPAGELESAILPARVADYQPQMLDELGAAGWLVWIGHGAPGRSGRIALYRRERVAALAGDPERPADLGAPHLAILDHLGARGASFFAALAEACAPATSEEVLAALRELVGAGLVTNDTFQPLRAAPPRAGTHRQRARSLARAAGGRWSLVADLLAGRPPPTERAHAVATALLERHGIVSREVADLEPLPGGFSGAYEVLRAMEEAGAVRRGYFIEGLGAAQFASPGAVERLRALRPGAGAGAGGGDPIVLAAVDPANPYGWLLPWPERPAPTDRGADPAPVPRRTAGASVVFCGGAPALYLGEGGRHLVSFPAAADREVLLAAAGALESLLTRRRRRHLRIEKIDGARATASPLAATLLEARFRRTYNGLELDLP